MLYSIWICFGWFGLGVREITETCKRFLLMSQFKEDKMTKSTFYWSFHAYLVNKDAQCSTLSHRVRAKRSLGETDVQCNLICVFWFVAIRFMLNPKWASILFQCWSPTWQALMICYKLLWPTNHSTKWVKPMSAVHTVKLGRRTQRFDTLKYLQ